MEISDTTSVGSDKVQNLKYGDVLKSMEGENEDKDLILAWRYNECIQTQANLKNKQQMGVHLLSDFQNREEYDFDMSHEMTDNISGLNVPINKDKYFHVIEANDDSDGKNNDSNYFRRQ